MAKKDCTCHCHHRDNSDPAQLACRHCDKKYKRWEDKQSKTVDLGNVVFEGIELNPLQLGDFVAGALGVKLRPFQKALLHQFDPSKPLILDDPVWTGYPQPDDVKAVRAWFDTLRPEAVRVTGWTLADKLAALYSGPEEGSPVAHAERTCPLCLTAFIPKRVDMLFCNPRCTDELYLKEEAAYVDFAKALLRQIFRCAMCGKSTDEIRLRPHFVTPSNPKSEVWAACLPCKQSFYKDGRHTP